MAGTIIFTPAEISTYYAVRVPSLQRPRARHWRGPCPIHRGVRNSFAVDSETGLWYCHSDCGRGGDLLSLERELYGGDFRSCKERVYSIIGRAPEPYSRAGRWRKP
jgi:hypothetical protein